MCQSNKKFKDKVKCPKVMEAFETLKRALQTEPILAYPDFNLPFIIQADASQYAIGAVIGQIRPDFGFKFMPIMFISRHLTAADSRYSTTERELLSLVFAKKKSNHYIYARHVTFVTDHKPLVSMKVLKEPMGRIGRLMNKLQDQDFTLVYQPGSKNITADLLSRPEKVVESVELKTSELVFQGCVNWAKEQT